MHFFTTLLFTAAISLDGLGLGLAYGIRKITISIPSLLLIGITSASSVATAMICGQLVSRAISPAIGVKIGAVFMLLLGFSIICKSNSPDKVNQKQKACNSTKDVHWYEAIILGLTLSLDAFWAGFGAAMSGSSILQITLLAGIMQVTFLTVGLFVGSLTVTVLNMNRLTRFPGWILLFVGLMGIIR